VNGFLAPPRDSKAFQERVEELVLDNQLRSRMSSAARAGAEHFEWNRILSQIVTYYGEIE
jgi:glycosyltransferase involved in cell wall biosynthesis